MASHEDLVWLKDAYTGLLGVANTLNLATSVIMESTLYWRPVYSHLLTQACQLPRAGHSPAAFSKHIFTWGS